MGKKRYDAFSRLTSTVTAVLVSAILLGSMLAIGYLMNVQTAQAAGAGEGGSDNNNSNNNDHGKGGEGADQQPLNALLGIARGDDHDRHNNRHDKNNGDGGGNDNNNDSGGGNDNSNNNNNDDNDSGGDRGGGGQDQYCYSATVTNPLNGKTRTVNVCFDSRSDCDQAAHNDPDSASECDTN